MEGERKYFTVEEYFLIKETLKKPLRRRRLINIHANKNDSIIW